MFSSSDLAGNQNNMHFTSQTQLLNSQLIQTNQPFYWNPNVHSIGTQLYYNNGMPLMPASNVSAMPYGTQTAPISLYNPPHYQSYQPPIQPSPQWTPVPLSTFMYQPSFLTNSQNSIGYPTRTCNPTPTSETQFSGQGSVSSSQSNGSLECSSLKPELPKSVRRPWEDDSTCTRVSTSFPKPKSNTSLNISGNQVSEDSSSTQTSPEVTIIAIIDNSTSPPQQPDVHPSSSKKQVSESALLTKASPQVNAKITTDDMTRASTSMSSSLPKARVPLISCDNQVSKYSPLTEVTVENSVDQATSTASDSPSPSSSNADLRQDHCGDSNNLTSSPIPTRATQFREKAPLPLPAPLAASSESILAVKMNKSHRYTICRCPYCRDDAFDRPRFKNGCVKHKCHFRDCGRVFRRPSHLKNHLKQHSSQKYPCEYCEKGFPRKIDFLAHIESHESQIGDVQGPKQHICHVPNCGKVFPYGWCLRRHLRSHGISKKFFCHHCDEGFMRKSKLVAHIKSHKNLWLSNCQLSNCNSEDGNRTKDFIDRRDYICPIPDCGKVCSAPWTLKTHLTWHSGKKDFICQFCDKACWRKDLLTAHLKKVHDYVEMKEPEGKSFGDTTSPDSGKSISLSDNDVENNLEDIGLQYACPFSGCRKIYVSSDSLEAHWTTHFENKD